MAAEAVLDPTDALTASEILRDIAWLKAGHL
jgi:hypothetical protein